jgi:hypothetical protein
VAGLFQPAASLLKIVKQAGIARALRFTGGSRNDVCERSRAGEEIDEGVH